MEHVEITLPLELKTRAETLARKEGISLEERIRNSLEERLAQTSQRDPFFADCEIFKRNTLSDLAENHDEYLYGDDY